MVTSQIAREITAALSVPTIGIGAGPDCDAQVLVWQDMAGLRAGRLPKFVKTYGDMRGTLLEATKAFAADVVSGSFPTDEHSYR
jgi:3-methyl-2-oxobutanoate hydroxymethyltransferase